MPNGLAIRRSRGGDCRETLATEDNRRVVLLSVNTRTGMATAIVHAPVQGSMDEAAAVRAIRAQLDRAFPVQAEQGRLL